jgi:hypothetical protein
MTTFTIYEFDEYAYYTGNSKEISMYDSFPNRWTIEQVPVIPQGYFAKFYDGHWIIVSHDRPYPSSPPDWQPGPYPDSTVEQQPQTVDPATVEQTAPEVL